MLIAIISHGIPKKKFRANYSLLETFRVVLGKFAQGAAIVNFALQCT